MGVRLHSWRNPEIYRRGLPHLTRDRGKAAQLGRVIHHDAADPCLQRHTQLGIGLVISMEIQPLGRESRLQRGIELPARDHVRPAAFLADDPVQFLKTAGFARVRDPAAGCSISVHRAFEFPERLPDGGFIHHIQRGAEGLRQRDGIASTDRQMTGGVDIQAVRNKHGPPSFPWYVRT